MIESKLYFMMGMQCSGKSTFCNKWVLEKPKRVIVSSDDIRLAMHGKRYEPLAETMVFATKHIMVRALLNRGFTVIVDGTHSTEISIQRLLEIDELAVAIIMDTPKETCIERAIQLGKNDLIPAIERIEKNLLKLGWLPNSGVHPTMNENLAKILDKVKERNLYGKT